MQHSLPPEAEEPGLCSIPISRSNTYIDLLPHPLLTPAPCCHCPKVTGDPKAKADCCSSQHFKSMALHTPPRPPPHTHQKETKALCSPHPESCQSPLPGCSPHCPWVLPSLPHPSGHLHRECTQVPRADSGLFLTDRFPLHLAWNLPF